MIFYKTFFRIIKGQKKLLIILSGLFFGILLFSTLIQNSNSEEEFKDRKLNIMILDEDNTELSKATIEYLKTIGDSKVIDKIDSVAKDDAYIGGYQGILKIENGFQNSILNSDTSKIKYYSGTASSSVASQNKIHEFLNTVYSYKEIGFNLGDSINKANSDLRESTSVELYKAENYGGSEESKIAFFGKISVIWIFYFSMMVFNVLFREIGKNEVNLRTICSGASVNKIYLRLIIFTISINLVFVLIVVGILAFSYYDEIFANNFIFFMFLNLFVVGLVSLSISFFTASVFKNKKILENINGFFSTILMFIGGLYVPLEIFPEILKKISEFTPLYWFSISNMVFNSNTPISGIKLREFSSGILMQLIFATLFISLSLILKNRVKSDIS